MGDSSLINHVLLPLSFVASFRTVGDYWEAGRGWKWEDLRGFLPAYFMDMLWAKFLLSDIDCADSFCWGPTVDGSFTVKSA